MTDETASVQGEVPPHARHEGWPDPRRRPPVPAPSDEAVEAAARSLNPLYGTCGYRDPTRTVERATKALTAAYAHDLPRLLAESTSPGVVPALSDEALRDLRYAKARLENDWSCAGGYHEDDCPRCEAHRRVCKVERAIPRLLAEARAEERAHYDEFIEGLTAKLNVAAVPAMPSWPDAIDWLIERAESARAEAQAARTAEIQLEQQRADIGQVYSLIDCVEDEWVGDIGPRARGARDALAHLRDQLALRFGLDAAHFNPEAES